MKFRAISLVIALVSVAGLIAACGGTTTNSNNSRANGVTNLGTNNANVGAVVVNANANTNMNSNRWNANVTREDYEKNKGDYDKDRGSSTIGSGANDSWLWVKTRASLLGTSDLRESTINVDVVNDVVTLKGTVANAAQKTKAEQVAKGIDGVKSVKNELKVAANDSMTNVSTSNSSNSNKH
ncbi:MAG TPA: BON domain-containing protein [Pyrinomonadaceae bacterium]|nr:BON domain-containing protein [Pyrinomonadaceae bacterium]